MPDTNRKRFHVSLSFPELASGRVDQDWTGEATNSGMAAHLAFKEVRKRPGVARKRIRTVKMTITELEDVTGVIR